ncbi:hypothetical protein [Flavobacterium sp.]|jgi:hypothetical protein|uniref:hypothetical protein n=1 Tax=Flavobacterium sp. TaxID=239 RepID=UPI0037BE72E5
MNHFSTQDNNKASRNLIMVIAFVLLSIGTSFGQTAVENNSISNTSLTTNTIETIVVKQEEASTNSNMNFVLWFMGSKQTPNANAVPAGANTKKQFITSGSAPNRLLIRAFLKKAVNFESSMV